MITLADGVAEHISTNGGRAFLRPSPRYGCCGGLVYLPVADVGRPSDSSDYLQVQVQDITIHLHTELIHAAEAGLTLWVDGFWRWRKLSVEPTPTKPTQTKEEENL